MNVRTKYEDQDFRNADAYFLRFEKKYEYYDDWNEELYNSFQIVCTDFTTSDENGCRTWDHIGSKIYTRGEKVIIGHPYIFDRWTIDEENIKLKDDI